MTAALGPPCPRCQDPGVPGARTLISCCFPAQQLVSPGARCGTALVPTRLEGSTGASSWGHPHVPPAPQFLLPHSRGSSHGQSRIIRSAYTEAPYARMMPDSFRLWQRLEAEAGTSLYR